MVTKKAKRKPAVQKLHRKDVLKHIDNLTNGQYLKGTGKLVSDDREHFCCLGVWADQHGCVWHKVSEGWIPAKGKLSDTQDTANLEKPISFGLDAIAQSRLASLNDNNSNWDEVLTYLVTEVLPKAV